MDTQLQRIIRGVTKFQSRLFVNIAKDCFNGFHQDLRKLKDWGTFNADCQLPLGPVIVHATTIVKKAKDRQPRGGIITYIRSFSIAVL